MPEDSTSSGRAPGMQNATGAGWSSSRVSSPAAAGSTTSSSSARCRRRVRAVRTSERSSTPSSSQASTAARVWATQWSPRTGWSGTDPVDQWVTQCHQASGSE
jgi:hypothetical protein